MDNQKLTRASQELLEMARQKQARAVSRAPGDGDPSDLVTINVHGDAHTQRRRRDLILSGLAIAVLLWFAWSSLFGHSSSPDPVKAAGVVTGSPTVVSANSLLSDLQKTVARPVSPAVVSDGTPAALRVKCYAIRDAVSDSGVSVVSGALLYVDGFTRAYGGMVFSSKYGWFAAKDFGCPAGELDQVEVEYVKATPTATKVAVRRVVASPTSAQLPTLAVVASPTLASGIVSFSVAGCDMVSYLAWNVKAVYLVRGSVRQGVPGDDHGAPVIMSVCPYTGTLMLAVVDQSGYVHTESREVQ